MDRRAIVIPVSRPGAVDGLSCEISRRPCNARSTPASCTFAEGTADLANRHAFTGFLGQLRAVNWIVYAKRPFAGPEQVLNYLGRYTHRVALSNDRLVDHRDGRVRFRWKDYADHDRVKVMTLEVDEFLRRFLLHVVPRGFMRIRHFGLLANRTRRDTLTRCRALLDQPPPREAPPESVVRSDASTHWRRPLALSGMRRGPDADHRDRRARDSTAGFLMRPRRPSPATHRGHCVRSVALCLALAICHAIGRHDASPPRGCAPAVPLVELPPHARARLESPPDVTPAQPYNPHRLRRRSHAASSNRVYPH